ncbi:hypothetical protein Droror1_Dr00011521 [Drosera rotundifolia]
MISYAKLKEYVLRMKYRVALLTLVAALDVILDVVTIAKKNLTQFYGIIYRIENGLPVGAVVTTTEIASVLAKKIQFNTFGGNPVCSDGGIAVLKVLDKEKRQQHSGEVDSNLIKRLRTLQQKHDK